jgi:hypothetical protein
MLMKLKNNQVSIDQYKFLMTRKSSVKSFLLLNHLVSHAQTAAAPPQIFLYSSSPSQLLAYKTLLSLLPLASFFSPTSSGHFQIQIQLLLTHIHTHQL